VVSVARSGRAREQGAADVRDGVVVLAGRSLRSGDEIACAGRAVFFIAAQVSAVAAGLALLQALALRHETMPPDQLALLARRNACALAAAGLTMLAAGAAIPGSGSAFLLAAGPVFSASRSRPWCARALARRLDGGRARAVRPPIPIVPMRYLLVLTTARAAAAAFLRDTAEHATASQALITASIEVAAVVACFLALGPALGLWRRRAASHRPT
jgi:hypothetical protein